MKKAQWFNLDIIKMMRERDRYYKKARRYNNEDVWSIARFWRNEVNSAVKSYKSNKIKAELEVNKNSPKKFWENIREILPKKVENTMNTLYNPENDSLIDKINLK